MGPRSGGQCQRGFFLHETRDPLSTPGAWWKHYQSLLHLRPHQRAGYSALSCLQGRGKVDDQNRRAALCQRKNSRELHPGYIWTPLVAALAEQSSVGPEAFRQHLASLHPLGHVGEPEDIGYGIVYLASDESKFVTGSELV